MKNLSLQLQEILKYISKCKYTKNEVLYGNCITPQGKISGPCGTAQNWDWDPADEHPWVSSCSEVPWRFYFLFNELFSLSNFLDVVFQHVKRSLNDVKDMLANEGMWLFFFIFSLMKSLWTFQKQLQGNFFFFWFSKFEREERERPWNTIRTAAGQSSQTTRRKREAKIPVIFPKRLINSAFYIADSAPICN